MRGDLGFSLAELMIVIAIIAILAALAMPNFIDWRPKQRLKTASQDILSAMHYTRSRALKDGANAAIRFNPANETYTVFIDNGTGGGTEADGTQNGSEPTVRSGRMPTGIDLQNTSFAGNTARFDARGFLSGAAGGTVNIRNSLNETKQISVNITGS